MGRWHRPSQRRRPALRHPQPGGQRRRQPLGGALGRHQRPNLRWATREIVSSTVQLDWPVRARIDSDLDTRWQVIGRIESMMTLSWVVSGAIYYVAADTLLSWAVRQGVTDTVDLQWLVTDHVQSDVRFLWSLGFVARDVQVEAVLAEQTRIIATLGEQIDA
jgi:hypothetical protein